MGSHKQVLITGISKGIGKSIAKILVLNGYCVAGTSQSPEKIKDRIKGVKYIQLNLSDPSSIENCIRESGHIDILINNAGICQFGPLEEIPAEKFIELFQVNIFGIIKLMQAFIPGMRKNRHGYLINIGSLAGTLPVPFQSGYAASKFALEGISWSLRTEIKRYGIRVVVIEPNDINTSMKPELFIGNDSVYKPYAETALKIQLDSMFKAPGPEVVAYKVLKILQKKNPNAFYPVGGIAPYFIFLKRFLSDRLVEKVIRNFYKQ